MLEAHRLIFKLPDRSPVCECLLDRTAAIKAWCWQWDGSVVVVVGLLSERAI